jgi:hypothetical protein
MADALKETAIMLKFAVAFVLGVMVALPTIPVNDENVRLLREAEEMRDNWQARAIRSSKIVARLQKQLFDQKQLTATAN